jgi:SMC interacting uncharacterized protein involved in chromosome segregation
LQGLFFLEYTTPATLGERLGRWIEGQVQEAHYTSSETIPTPSQKVTNRQQIRAIQQEIAQHQRVLQHLKSQAAQYSASAVPAHLKIDIEDKEDQIEVLELQLEELLD